METNDIINQVKTEQNTQISLKYEKKDDHVDGASDGDDNNNYHQHHNDS